MITNNKKKFVASYSGGKDSIMSIYRAIKQGAEITGLLTTFDEENNRSWYHNIPLNVLYQTAEALKIPLTIVKTKGEQYGDDFEKTLWQLKGQGAQGCIFGDIDIEEHKAWCGSRCEGAQMACWFPLWQENRKDIVYEFVRSGFKAVITVIDSDRMPEKYLGQTLTTDIIEQMVLDGIDVCGENGEYHTIVYDGPLFASSVELLFGTAIKQGKHIRIPILNSGGKL